MEFIQNILVTIALVLMVLLFVLFVINAVIEIIGSKRFWNSLNKANNELKNIKEINKK